MNKDWEYLERVEFQHKVMLILLQIEQIYLGDQDVIKVFRWMPPGVAFLRGGIQIIKQPPSITFKQKDLALQTGPVAK